MRVSLTLIAMFALLPTGCKGGKVTEIVISVATDLVTPDELSAIELTADYGDTGEAGIDLSWDVGAGRPDAISLPATIGLLPADDPSRPILITIAGFSEQAELLERKARLPFAVDRIVLLKMNLLRSCVHKQCPEGTTCEAGGLCQPIGKDPTELDDYDRDTALAGVDASADGPLDSGVDIAPDDGITPDADMDKADTVGPDSVVDTLVPDGASDTGPLQCPGEWCPVPSGSFQMGSPTSEICRDDDETQHAVVLTHDIEIASTEVTQKQFNQKMGYNPSLNSGCDSCPVENVTWHEAAAYCNALTAEKGGLSLCYSCTGTGLSTSCDVVPAHMPPPNTDTIYECTGYRLPTESEWEYAARAGSIDALHSGPLQSCTGADPNADAIAWYLYNSGGQTQPVGGKPPNAWGLHDMSGNVFEWAADGWDDKLLPPIDPWFSTVDVSRRVRGGSAYSEPELLRVANRAARPVNPPERRKDVGFRCARSLN